MVARRLLVSLAALLTLSVTRWLARPLAAQSTSGSTVSPLCALGCGGSGSPVSVTPTGTGTDTAFTGSGNQTLWFTVKNTGSSYDTYTLTSACSHVTCVGQSATQVSLGGGASANETVTFTPATAGTNGTVSLTAADSGCNNFSPAQSPGPSAAALTTCNSSTGTWNIVNLAGDAPVVSVAPYNAGFQSPRGAVVYQHATPVIGSMGGQWALALRYSSASAHPVVFVTVDVTNSSTSTWYPSTYELQVQNPSTVVSRGS